MTLTFNGNCCAFGATGSCNVPIGTTCSDGVTKQDQMTVTVNSSGCRIISPLIGKEENSSYVVISPNPNSGKFNVTISDQGINFINFEKSIPQIAVYDGFGKLVYNLEAQGKVTEIDISTFPKGVYFIRVIDKEEILVVKKVLYN